MQNETINIPDMVFKFKPFRHQAEALLASRDKKFYAYLFEMGLGKTKICIDNTAYLFAQGKVNGLLVVAPKSICHNWASKEIPTHLPDHIFQRTVLWGADTKQLANQLKTLEKVEPLHLHIFVINIEALNSERGYKAAEKFLKGHNALMVVDESTVIKNHTAKRTKKVTKLGYLASYRRIMTGTPVTQSPLDIWGQFEFLEHGILGSSSYYGFRNQYAVLRKRYVNGRSFDEIIGFQRLQELQDLIKKHSFRALKKDCLDLPEKVYTLRYVELTEKQQNFYKQMVDESMVILDSGDVVTAPLVLTQILKLRQSLCNIVQVDGEVRFIDDEDPRLNEVLSIIEEAGNQKIIIWANFIPSIRKLHTEIGKAFGTDKVGYISGEINADQRQNLVNAFQDKESKLQYLVMQPRTGGFGLTLTEATVVIYYDNDWSLEVRLQSEDRAHRIGQKNNVTYIDLVAKGTVDEKVRKALIRKRNLADKITGDNLRNLLTADNDLPDDLETNPDMDKVQFTYSEYQQLTGEKL